jgi:hypothetical protein
MKQQGLNLLICPYLNPNPHPNLQDDVLLSLHRECPPRDNYSHFCGFHS